MDEQTMHTTNELGILIIQTGGLLRLPKMGDDCLYANTKDIAMMLGVTPQRVNQYCATEGLPKADRNKFYIPEVMNWQKVKAIAEILHVNPRELASYGYVDFTLGDRSAPEINPNVMTKSETEKRTQATVR